MAQSDWGDNVLVTAVPVPRRVNASATDAILFTMFFITISSFPYCGSSPRTEGSLYTLKLSGIVIIEIMTAAVALYAVIIMVSCKAFERYMGYALTAAMIMSSMDWCNFSCTILFYNAWTCCEKSECHCEWCCFFDDVFHGYYFLYLIFKAIKPYWCDWMIKSYA